MLDDLPRLPYSLVLDPQGRVLTINYIKKLTAIVKGIPLNGLFHFNDHERLQRLNALIDTAYDGKLSPFDIQDGQKFPACFFQNVQSLRRLDEVVSQLLRMQKEIRDAVDNIVREFEERYEVSVGNTDSIFADEKVNNRKRSYRAALIS